MSDPQDWRDRNEKLLIAAVLIAPVALVVGLIAWLATSDAREKRAFVDTCAASGRHDRWECLALWGQSQGVPAPRKDRQQ